MKKMIRTFLFGLLIFGTAVMSYAAPEKPKDVPLPPFALSNCGKGTSLSIVVDADAPACMQFAALELRMLLGKITGYEPYSNGIGGNRNRIILACPQYRKNVYDNVWKAFAKDLEAIGKTDGYSVRRFRNSVYIVANKPKGVLNGVYDFLERNTDIVFIRPNQEPVFTVTPDLKAKETDFMAVPDFTDRCIQSNIESLYAPSQRYLARMRCNGREVHAPSSLYDFHKQYGMYVSFGGGHNLNNWVPEKEFMKTHPEYFCLIDGKRVARGAVQLCFTNPELPGVIAEKILKAHEKAPSPDFYEYYGVMLNDCDGSCECPECLKPIKLEDGSELPVLDPAFRSTQHFIFINRIAEKVAAVNPNIRVCSYAYLFTAVPPKVKLHPNVIASYCIAIRSDKEVIESAANKQWDDRTRGWAALGADLIWREYFGLGASFCRPVSDVVAKDFRYLKKLGIHRTNIESSFHEDPDRNDQHVPFDVSAMEYYVVCHLLWNVNADVTGLRRDFLRRACHEAAPVMERFWNRIIKSWYSTKDPSTFLDSPVKSYDRYIVAAGIEKDCFADLDEAEKLAKHPGSLAYIRNIRKRFEEWSKLAAQIRMPELQIPCVDTLPAGFDDDVWNKAVVMKIDNHIGSTDKTPYPTAVRILHDRKTIAFRFDCITPLPKEINGLKPTDKEAMTKKEPWCSGEHVEMFIDGDLGAKGSYYFLAFNYYGLKFDQIGTSSSADWNGKWDLKIRDTENGWQAIMTLPFDTIGVNVSQLSHLRGTVYKQTNCGKGKQGKHDSSSWGGSGLHSPAGFGDLIFHW